jgi:serine/threonine protein kinase
MDPLRWRRVSAVLHDAIALPLSERAAFLDRACADAEDRREVESLLRHHDAGDGFLEQGAGAVAADLLPGGGLTPGQILGSYVIVREIGRGGMGVVYLAHDQKLDRDVAIKMLPPELGHDHRRRERLRLEARAAAAVPHPGIAHVYALEEDEHGAGYVVSEYVEGRTLRDELQEGPLPGERAVATAVQVASAAAAAHARGVVHRDLKPENVMRARDGSVKVLDFGLARLVDRSAEAPPAKLTRTGGLMGTPGYMSPEQLRGLEAGAATDIFSLGLLLHEMLTGKHAFDGGANGAMGTMVRLLEDSPGPLPPDVTAAWPGVAAVIERCLQKDPAARFPTMQDVVDALQQPDRTGLAPTSPAAASRSGSVGMRQMRVADTWWWQFHQIAVSALYIAMIYPTWRLRGSPLPSWGHSLLVLAIIGSASLATTLRLHRLFIARVHPDRLVAAERRTRRLVRWSDALMSVLLLGAAAAALARDQFWFAALFATVSVSGTVASRLIEPATVDATFGSGDA